MERFVRSDLMVTMIAMVAIASVGALAIGLMSFSQESAGETYESDPVDVSLSAPGSIDWVHADRMSIRPYATVINEARYSSEAIEITRYNVPNLHLAIEVPSYGGSFRYLEIDWDAEDGDVVTGMARGIDLSRMTLDISRGGLSDGSMRISGYRGMFGEDATNSFDGIEFVLYDKPDLTLTFKLGMYENGAVDEYVYTYNFHVSVIDKK